MADHDPAPGDYGLWRALRLAVPFSRKLAKLPRGVASICHLFFRTPEIMLCESETIFSGPN
jgi:hypothetical protein